jgi:hypothetical protein
MPIDPKWLEGSEAPSPVNLTETITVGDYVCYNPLINMGEDQGYARAFLCPKCSDVHLALGGNAGQVVALLPVKAAETLAAQLLNPQPLPEGKD